MNSGDPHIEQYYNAVEDERMYMNEYLSLIHRYNDFIMTGNAMFMRMEQTLRENISRSIVRQTNYYHQLEQLRQPRSSSNARSRGNERNSTTVPLLSRPLGSAAPPPPPPSPPPRRETRYGDILTRLLSSSGYTNAARDTNNLFSMLYTVPIGGLATATAGAAGASPAAGPPTNDQIASATLNTVFANILSPVNATCPISRDEFNDESEITMIRGCNHIFNRASLREWFANHSTCPMCRSDIRLYRPQGQMPTAAASAAPAPRAAVPTNISIDSADENHITFSYDLPVYYNDDQIYRDIVNTISGMTRASAATASANNTNNNTNNNNTDNNPNNNDDDIMEVD
jgi:hypothetical protein